MAAIYGNGESTTHVYQGGEDGELAPTTVNSSDDASVFAAAGHNYYTKSAYIYLQIMKDLPQTHPIVHEHFLHVVRRSNRYWAGLSTDLIIEQVLMRSLKTSGGLTRG